MLYCITVKVTHQLGTSNNALESIIAINEKFTIFYIWMRRKLTKAAFPVTDLGTRFLPAPNLSQQKSRGWLTGY